MSLSFEDATAVRPTEAGWVAELDERWDLDGPSGGITAAIMVRAAGAALGPGWVPASLSCRFLRASAHGPASVELETTASGIRTRALGVRLRQSTVVADAAVWAVRDGIPGPAAVGVVPPLPLPPPGLNAARPRHGSDWPFFDRIEEHPPRGRAWSLDDGSAALSAWVRPRPAPATGSFEACDADDRWLAAGRAAMLIDTYPFLAMLRARPDHGVASEYLARTLNLSVTFSGRPAAGSWTWLDVSARPSGSAVLTGRGQVRDERGTTIAEGMQSLLSFRSRSR